MAYQNVGTPRFYVDDLNYLLSIGRGSTSHPEVFGLNPTNIYSLETNGSQYKEITFDLGMNAETLWGDKLLYSAMLGHKFASEEIPYTITESGDVHNWFSGHSNAGYWLVNDSPFRSIAPLDGFSIRLLLRGGVDTEKVRINFGQPTLSSLPDRIELGAWSLGHIYDMPHSPDLNLKLSYEYDGVKTIQTKGGATLSNASYTKPADWGDAGAWQLSGVPNHRSGRRSWDLSFSYLSDTDVFPTSAHTEFHIPYKGTGVPIFDSDSDEYNWGVDAHSDGTFTPYGILTSTDFFSQVWNRTMGGHLPFIFQPDKNNNNPDQFAIARFDQSSLQYEQVANNVYNVKLKIRECW